MNVNFVATCHECEVTVTIDSPDPQAIGLVYCPECRDEMEGAILGP